MDTFRYDKTDPTTGRRLYWRRTRDNSVDDAGFEWTDGSIHLEPTDDELSHYANRDNPDYRR